MLNNSQLTRLTAMALFLITALFFNQVVNGAEEAKKEKPEKTKCENKEFTGTYKIVSGEKEGKVLKGKELKATKVVIEGNRIRTLDKSDGELYVADFELQPHDKGCYIVMKSVKPPMPGIGAVGLIDKNKNGQVRLIYGFPNVEAPTEFKTSKGQHMFIMKKVDESKDIRETEAVPVN